MPDLKSKLFGLTQSRYAVHGEHESDQKPQKASESRNPPEYQTHKGRPEPSIRKDLYHNAVSQEPVKRGKPSPPQVVPPYTVSCSPEKQVKDESRLREQQLAITNPFTKRHHRFKDRVPEYNLALHGDAHYQPAKYDPNGPRGRSPVKLPLPASESVQQTTDVSGLRDQILANASILFYDRVGKRGKKPEDHFAIVVFAGCQGTSTPPQVACLVYFGTAGAIRLIEANGAPDVSSALQALLTTTVMMLGTSMRSAVKPIPEEKSENIGNSKVNVAVFDQLKPTGHRPAKKDRQAEEYQLKECPPRPEPPEKEKPPKERAQTKTLPLRDKAPPPLPIIGISNKVRPSRHRAVRA